MGSRRSEVKACEFSSKMVMLMGLGGSGSRGYAKMLTETSSVYVPTSIKALDYFYFGKIKGRVNGLKNSWDAFYASQFEVSGMTQFRAIDTALGKNSNICPRFDLSETDIEIVKGLQESMCSLQRRVAQSKERYIAIKHGKLAFGVPSSCEAARRSRISLRFVLYVRNGLDMALTDNLRQLNAAKKSCVLDFKILNERMRQLSVWKVWTHLMKLIGYDAETSTLRSPSSEPILDMILQGVYWATLYTHSEACMRNWCDLDTETLILRFEDFISSDESRDQEIRRTTQWLNLDITRDEMDRMNAVFRTRIGVRGTIDLVPEKHMAKYKRIRGGDIVVCALALIPKFVEVMSRYGYDLPDIDPYEVSF